MTTVFRQATTPFLVWKKSFATSVLELMKKSTTMKAVTSNSTSSITTSPSVWRTSNSVNQPFVKQTVLNIHRLLWNADYESWRTCLQSPSISKSLATEYLLQSKLAFKLAACQLWSVRLVVTFMQSTLLENVNCIQQLQLKIQLCGTTCYESVAKTLSTLEATSSSTEQNVSWSQWKTLHQTVLLLKSTSAMQSELKLQRFSHKKTECANHWMLKSAVTVCSWSKSAPLVQLQFQLSC